jgi:hypothetical protein
MGKVSIKQVRADIAAVYGVGFVANKKPRQLFAIWNSMQGRGKFEPVENEYHQMNLFEWLKIVEDMKGEHIDTFR